MPKEPEITVAVVMGSKSDWDVMQFTSQSLSSFEVRHECRVFSAHRTPKELTEWLDNLEGRGTQVIIAAAGGAAHLAGVVASQTLIPVLGVPMQSSALNGLDSLLSTVQMPAGVPVGTLAIGKPGAINAALLAIGFLARADTTLRDKLAGYRKDQAQRIVHEQLP
jgi:5-(carboxyamino)imidazole ribonucleotide mutase